MKATKELKLKSLHIELQTYGMNEGRYTGSARFEGGNGAIETVLDPEVSQDLLSFLAPRLGSYASKATEEVAQAIKFQALPIAEPSKALTDKNDDVPF